MITLRPAREVDLGQVVDLLRASWLTTWAPHLALATVERFGATDPAASYAVNQWRQFILAAVDGLIAGMCHVEDYHVQALHIAPDRKRQGMGSLLLLDAETRIRTKHRHASLDVLTFNHQALRFYETRGWKQMRQFQTTECGETVQAIEMIKHFNRR